MVAHLSSQLVNVCAQLDELKNSPPMVNQTSTTYASTVTKNLVDLTNNNGASRPRQQETPSAQSRDRNHNLVLFGIDECESGIQRLERSLRDLGNVTSVLCDLDSNISNNTVVDCHRLGKFSPDKE